MTVKALDFVPAINYTLSIEQYYAYIKYTISILNITKVVNREEKILWLYQERSGRGW